MSRLVRAYDLVIAALPWFGGAVLTLMFFLILVDVSIRTLGGQPPAGTVSLTELGLLYFTMACAPYLLRLKSHILIDSIRRLAGRRFRAITEPVIYALGVIICAVICVGAGFLTEEYMGSGELEIRSISFPRWLLTAPLVVGFFLCAIEFLRLLITRDTLFEGEKGSGEGV